MGKATLIGVAAMFAGLAILAQVAGQTVVKVTLIAIEDLDCPVCAQTIEKSLVKIAGVSNVTTNVEKRTATVAPLATKAPSPRAMWEAVEKAGFHPTRLIGPTGTFTSKPPR